MAADSDEGGKTDFGQLVRHVPITDRADNCEFVRPIHRVIYWFGEMVEAVDDLAGPHGKAAHVPPIELVDSREVLGILVVLARLVLRERGLRLPRPLSAEPLHLPDGQPNAREASRDDEAPQVPLILHGTRLRQTTPLAGT